jgi:hypothetical protein
MTRDSRSTRAAPRRAARLGPQGESAVTRIRAAIALLCLRLDLYFSIKQRKFKRLYVYRPAAKRGLGKA